MHGGGHLDLAIAASIGPVEIARNMAHDLGRGIGEQRLVAGNGAREDIVDHHGRDGGDEASRGREQGLRDARRHDGEIAGVALRDRDETVHDAPDRAEEADERRRRADGRQQAGAAHHGAPGARLATRERGRDALLDALGRQAGGSAKLGCRRIEELREPLAAGEDVEIGGCCFCKLSRGFR